MKDGRHTEPTIKPASQLVDLFKDGVIQIPEIQRDVVWGPEDVISLIDSIYYDYPCGSLILWEPRLRDVNVMRDLIRPEILEYFGKLDNKYSPQYFLIDGQQRVTALASVILGSDFLNKREPEAEYNWPTFYIDAKSPSPKNISVSSDEGEYKFPIVPLYSLFDFSLEKDPNYEKLKTDHKTKLREFCDRIRNYSFPVQIIKGFDYPTVGKVFERVNTQGTQLTGAEIYIARIIPHWKGITKEFRSYLRELKNEYGYTFDLTLLIRCLAVIATDSPRIKSFSEQVSLEMIRDSKLNGVWRECKRSISALVKILKKDGFLESSRFITSKNAFIPLVYYLNKSNNKVQSKKSILKFLFMSQLGSHYGSGTEGVLRKDISLLANEHAIKPALVELCSRVGQEAKDEQKLRKYLILNSAVIGSASKNPIFLMMYVALIQANARDFSITQADLLGKTPPDDLSIHHIFPSKFMQKDERAQEFKTSHELSSSEFYNMINDIANLTVLSRAINANIGEAEPFEYMANATTTENLRAHCIPLDKELWKPQNFDKFLEARRILLKKAINRILRRIR